MNKIFASAAVLILACALSGASAQSVVIRDDFETSYDGWTDTGAYTRVTAVSEAGYNSSRGLKVTGRRAPADGAVSAKGFYLIGGEPYGYSVYVKHAGAAAETFNLTVRYWIPDYGAYGHAVVATATAQPNQWTRLEGSYATPKGSVNQTFFITTNSAVDFCFDEFTAVGRAVPGLAKTMANEGLKDVYANKFRVGSVLNGSTVNNSAITALMVKEFNSITMENEMKPDATLKQSGSTDANIQVQLNTGAAAILKFCSDKGIGVRGHTLVWHSQTPQWFFKSDFTNNGSWASTAVMDQRMESYIKNMFAIIKSQYPNVNLYAYDVVNEAVSDNSGNTSGTKDGARDPGYNDGKSPWVQVYGSNSFIEKAFTFARKYAPPETKLFYNDYNEYWDHKRNCIVRAILTPLYQKGVLDGMGMQSHINADTNANVFAGTNSIRTAANMYTDIGCEVQMTELDISTEGGKYSLQIQAEKYKAVFKIALDTKTREGKTGVTAVCVWGPNDANSWVGKDDNGNSNAPLLFDANNNKKPAYDAVFALVPSSEWGDGNNPTFGGGGGTPIVVEPDANGYYFYHPYEDGTAQGWTGRGGASVANTNAQKANGSRSLAVTGRAASWHGAIYSLNANAFVPGKAYSFSVLAMYPGGAGAPATDNFKFTMEYKLGDSTIYDQIASATARAGAWVLLDNANFTIPAGATGVSVYVEMPDNDTSDFYIDDAMGGVAGTAAPGREGVTSVRGGVAADRGRSPIVTVKARTLNVKAPPESKVGIRIVNLTGKTVAAFKSNGSASFSLRKIPAGSYIAETSVDGRKAVSAVMLR